MGKPPADNGKAQATNALFGLNAYQVENLSADLAAAVYGAVAYDPNADEEAITGPAVGGMRRVVAEVLGDGVRIDTPNKHAGRPDWSDPWRRAPGTESKRVGE